MSERFDEFSQQLGNTTSRRGMLKVIGGAVAAVTVGNLLKPFRASAVPVCSGPTTVPCGPGTTPCNQCCCQRGIACQSWSKSLCGCPAGTTPCGNACCRAGVACSSTGKSTCTGADSVATCLGSGTVCGNTCCPAGQCCNNGTCGACSVCTQSSDVGNNPVACPGNFSCICGKREGSGDPVCVSADGQNGFPCTTATVATDCPANSACVTSDLYGNYCFPICSTGP